MQQESIYNLIPKEYTAPTKDPTYKSKYPANLPPTGSTFCHKTTSKPGVPFALTPGDQPQRWVRPTPKRPHQYRLGPDNGPSERYNLFVIQASASPPHRISGWNRRARWATTACHQVPLVSLSPAIFLWLQLQKRARAHRQGQTRAGPQVQQELHRHECRGEHPVGAQSPQGGNQLAIEEGLWKSPRVPRARQGQYPERV